MLLIERQHVLVSTNKVIIEGYFLAVFFHDVVHCLHLGYELSVTFFPLYILSSEVSGQNAILWLQNCILPVTLSFDFLAICVMLLSELPVVAVHELCEPSLKRFTLIVDFSIA